MWNRTDADSFGGLNKLYENNVVLKIHCSALNQRENADAIMNVFFFKLLAFISEVIIDQPCCFSPLLQSHLSHYLQLGLPAHHIAHLVV